MVINRIQNKRFVYIAYVCSVYIYYKMYYIFI